MVLSKQILRPALLLLFLLTLTLLVEPQEPQAEPTPFDVEGECVWACSCDVVCPCVFGSPNTTDNGGTRHAHARAAAEAGVENSSAKVLTGDTR